MALPFRVALTTDVMPAIEAWRDRYVSAVGVAKYNRAAQWTVDEVAKRAVVGIREKFTQTLTRQVPWTKSAIRYERSTAAGLKAVEAGRADGIFASVEVMPKQSVYLKYLFGVGQNVRFPGDVGLAQNRILLPFWENITLTQGVRPTRYGGVPTGFLARLNREVQGTKAPARSGRASRWGVYYGTITMHGQPRLAYIARPPRVATSEATYVPARNGGMKRVGRRMRDIDHPRVLFLAVDRATYQPSLEKPWREACDAAAARIDGIMAAQLADNIAHRNAKLRRAA